MAAFRYLCKRLGKMRRLTLRLPRIEDGAGDVEVRWPCGCTAAGETLRAVTLHPCDEHAAREAEERARDAEPPEGLL